METQAKVCQICGVEKPLEDFTPQKAGKFGRLSYCGPCNAAYVRERSKDPRRKAQTLARKRRRALDPVKREMDAAAQRARRERDPERFRAFSRTAAKIANNQAWARRNPEKRRASAKKYQAAHPEVGVVSAQRRRARKLGVGSTLTAAQWRQVLTESNHRCAYCMQADVPLQQEHMQPLSKGGAHSVGNVIPSCASCNYRKHTRDLLQFLSMGV